MATSGEPEESSYMEQLMRLWIPYLIGKAVMERHKRSTRVAVCGRWSDEGQSKYGEMVCTKDGVMVCRKDGEVVLQKNGEMVRIKLE